MHVPNVVANALEHGPSLLRDRPPTNLRVTRALIGPAVRGLLLKRGKAGPRTHMPARGQVCFNWTYEHDDDQLSRLTRAARKGQWDPERDLDWSIDVDPHDPEVQLFPDEELALREISAYQKLTRREQEEHRLALLAWMLSQFLHGEQGALFVACQLTESVEWIDGKLYGSTQVADEGRHVEVFDRYLEEKLQKRYPINDNLFVILDAVMRDSRWDMKFLGMQILVEGLALGAFGTMRQATEEPLLRDMLRLVITDEARHVHFGVLALQKLFKDLSPRQIREREDWAYEVCVMARNRFLCHEFYEEYYGHCMSMREWDQLVLETEFMKRFRHTMFRRIIPNLKRIGLLSERMRPYYAEIGLLELEKEKAMPDLLLEELVAD